MGGESPERKAAMKAEADASRRAEAEKWVDAIVGIIIERIIRPGPKPEERECTTVAAELEAFKLELVNRLLGGKQNGESLSWLSR